MALEDILKLIGEQMKEKAEFIGFDVINSKISDFITETEKVSETLKEIEADGRVMRLGIVGMVKAGKTSFLNALLFDGKNVLPKAATPMTAALTHIRYGEKPRATVIFYSRKDWDYITEQSRRYTEKLDKSYEQYCKAIQEENKRNQQKSASLTGSGASVPQKQIMPKERFAAENNGMFSNEEASCHEVFGMAEKNMSAYDIDALLGTEKEISSSLDEKLMTHLRDYVGADGRFTPVVKYTVIEMHRPELEGLEIIDTPGMDDPIRSRGNVTREFLRRCDALFLLSYSGRFLDEEDIKVMSRLIPEEGIARYVLLGTKFDSAVLQSRKGLSFREAYSSTQRALNGRAAEEIRKLGSGAEQRQLTDPNNNNAVIPPCFTSSVAYSAARTLESGGILGSEERLMLDNFSKRFADFPESNADFLKKFSQIPTVKEKIYPAVSGTKRQIISEKISGIREGQKTKFIRLLEGIVTETRQIRKELAECDADGLKEKLRAAEEALDSARRAVSGAFDDAAIWLQKHIIPDMQVEIRSEVNNHLNIDVVTETRTEHHSESSGWWIFKTTESWTEVITTHTANVADSERNIMNFCTEILRIINEAMRDAIKLDSVKQNVINAVLKAFNASDRNFDENEILIPLKNTLERITIPEISVQTIHYIDQFNEDVAPIVYNGTVKNEEIGTLKKIQNETLMKIAEDICSQIQKEGDKMVHELEMQAGVFIDTITSTLRKKHKAIMEMINEKEKNLELLDELTDFLTSSKSKIRESEL